MGAHGYGPRPAYPPAGKAGLALTELSNGFASADDPALLQKICDALQLGTVNVFSWRWLPGKKHIVVSANESKN
jgi:hypothetical protein